MNRYQQLSLALLLVCCGIASGATRVLVTFDATGHRVHQVHRVTTRSVIPLEPVLRSWKADNTPVPPGQARSIWLDESGQQLAVTLFRDPRLQHAVSKDRSVEFAADYVLRDDGAYLLSGPDAAVSVVVKFPAVELGSVLLLSEHWTFHVGTD